MTPAEKKGLKPGQWVWFVGDVPYIGRHKQWLQFKRDDGTLIPSFFAGSPLNDFWDTRSCWFVEIDSIDWSRGIHDENPATAKLRHGDKVRVCVKGKENKKPSIKYGMQCMDGGIYIVGQVTKSGFYRLTDSSWLWHRDWLELVKRADKSTEDTNNMSNKIKVTPEMKDALEKVQAAFERGEAVTIEPPKPKKWEPEGGPWWISGRHEVDNAASTEGVRLAGRERKREDIAERDAKEGKLHDLLMAYRAQYAPDYVVPLAGQGAYEVIMLSDGRVTFSYRNTRTLGSVHFPEWLAEQLQDDINSDRFEVKP